MVKIKMEQRIVMEVKVYIISTHVWTDQKVVAKRINLRVPNFPNFRGTF